MDIQIGEGRCEGELPWGYLDKNGKVHSNVIMREMTGYEEDIFFSDRLDVRTRLMNIVCACTEKIGDIDPKDISQAVQEVTPADFMYMLLMVRIASIGKEYSWPVACEACSKEFQASVDLEELDVMDASKVGAKNIRLYDLSLPSNKTAKVKVPTMREVISREAIQSKNKGNRDRMTDMLLSRVSEVDGVATNKDLLKKLSLRDRNFLRAWIKKAETGIDDGIEVECSNTSCGKVFNTSLDVGQLSFFFPDED